MAKVIMVQGTMSNVGKSLVVAGLCRIFHQDGYRVAPFKSQNMALNSYITKEGLEMGRAQVMQAEAAGVEPSVLMNPILLKPTSDVGSQVIVNGVSRQNMPAREYFAYKKELIPDIMAAFEKLAADNDIIVIEGAGSPAEINLKQEDIVNMGLAKMVDAPVLLVGDIDRGGVFAQLYGTVGLLEKEEKERIKGLIINKFRGDQSILDSGIEMIEKKCKTPVVGLIPYMQVDLDDEDSLSDRLNGGKDVSAIDIAVIKLKRISNFTDFNVFERMKGVSLRYVDKVSDLRNPDMIILPGTKNTIDDLKEIRQNGLEAAIIKAASKGTPVWGVCGGYQMLGQEIMDFSDVEGGGTIQGMGLLPTTTMFRKEKTKTQVTGKFMNVEGIFKDLTGKEVKGYEIHMGISGTGFHSKELLELKEVSKKKKKVDELEEAILAGSSMPLKAEDEVSTDGGQKGNIYGGYLHGVFDAEGIAETIVQALADKKGIPYTAETIMPLEEYKESQYDLLADTIRQHVNMSKIYEIMGM